MINPMDYHGDGSDLTITHPDVYQLKLLLSTTFINCTRTFPLHKDALNFCYLKEEKERVDIAACLNFVA